MKEMPKKIWRQEIFPDEARQLFEMVRDRALTVIKPATLPDDGRRGFGVVYATEPLTKIGLFLNQWRWRRMNVHHCSMALGAGRFMDDPLGAAPTDSLAWRSRPHSQSRSTH
ncbi:MAG: hypothetical protein EOP94_02085 [Zymomonas sp.]|nr:MAG: hypothetical protein EOP94_02085 [Zymomonas sp.]